MPLPPPPPPAGSGTVTDVTSPDSSVKVTTGTTTPKLEVQSSPKINATAVTGNPAAAGKVLTSTGADAADWATATSGGTVTDVTSPTGTISVTTGTTTPKVEVAKVPTTAVVAGTHITVTTTAGKAKITGAAPGTGTVTDVTSPTGTISVATPTTTPKIDVTKVPSGAVVAGTRITITATAGKAKITATVQTATGAAGGGLAGTYPDPTVASVPSTALVAGSNVTLATTAGKAKISATAAGEALWISGYWYGARMTSSTGVTIAIGACYFLPFVVLKSFTCKALGAYVVTALASSTLRFGIYATTGAGKPGARVLDAGTVAAATSGAKTVATTHVLAPGVWWLCIVHQGITGTLGVKKLYGVWAEGTENGLQSLTTTITKSFYGWKATTTAVTGALPATAPAVAVVTALTPPMPAVLAKSA